jgi:pseudaminic acid cytidylyltransferase
MKLAIIPARSGSKRIPNKNIKEFAGHPIIFYSIDVAKKSKLFDKIVVSTDSIEIAKIATSYGAEVPFIRPKALADDMTGTVPVLEHALKFCKSSYGDIESFCCIYATAPFLTVDYLKKGFELLVDTRSISVIAVSSYPSSVYRALKIEKDGYLHMVWPENENVRSNELSVLYHDVGQFYWGNTERFLKARSLLSKDCVPVIIPRYFAHDIDTPEDWETAEKIYLFFKKEGIL